MPVDEMLLQRYQDADVQTVGSTIALQREYGKRAWNWKPWAIGGTLGVVVLLAGAVYLAVLRSRRRQTGSVLPENLTPFTVLEFLGRARGNDKLSEPDRKELEHCIATLETHFFAADSNGERPDLRRIAERWMVLAAE
jgi:hypothetical protein